MANELNRTFSITFKKEFQSFAYNIQKLDDGKFALERLETKDEFLNDKSYKRKFYLKNSLQQKNDLLFVSLKNKKLFINRYILDDKSLKIQKNISNVSCNVISTKNEYEFKFDFGNGAEKNISIFDINKKQDMVPALFYNNYKKKVQGKFKLNGNEKYIILKDLNKK